MPEEFTPLPDTKKKNGYLYTMIDRTETAAIYSMVNEKYPPSKLVIDKKGKEKWKNLTPEIEGFEVFQIKHAPAHTLIGKAGPTKGKHYDYPPSEKFPGNEDFGKWAWTFITEENARAKFEELKAA